MNTCRIGVDVATFLHGRQPPTTRQDTPCCLKPRRISTTEALCRVCDAEQLRNTPPTKRSSHRRVYFLGAAAKSSRCPAVDYFIKRGARSSAWK